MNRTYATVQVLQALALVDDSEFPAVRPMREAGAAWLHRAQGDSGGWGGDLGAPASIEETALALGAQFVIAGPSGTRTVPAAEFFVDLFETDDGTETPPVIRATAPRAAWSITA